MSTCGTSCTPCPLSTTNAQATCAGTPPACGVACNAGFHSCSGQCVSNTSPATCGSLCTPCDQPVGSSATCTGSPPACGLNWDCPSGQHVCGNACVPQSVAQCGPSCALCPDPGDIPNAQAACSSGGDCSVVCQDQYHDCRADGATDPSCVSNSDPETCGSACSPCPIPVSNGSATCAAGLCGVTCDTGYQQCGTAGAPDCTLTCGDGCSNPCSADDPNATPTCNGTVCGFTCNSDYHLCGTASCAPNGDSTQCGIGADCGPCPDETYSCADGITCTPAAGTGTDTSATTGTDTSVTTGTDTSAAASTDASTATGTSTGTGAASQGS